MTDDGVTDDELPDDELPDDFAATSMERPAFDFDAIARGESAEATTPATSPPRDVAGPAWAGTLPGIRDEAPPTVAATPAPAPIPPTPSPTAPDPTNFAATTAHARMYPFKDEPAYDDLEQHEEQLALIRTADHKPRVPKDDRDLKVALAVVLVLIGIVTLGTIGLIAYEFTSPPAEETGEERQNPGAP